MKLFSLKSCAGMGCNDSRTSSENLAPAITSSDRMCSLF